MPSSPKSGAYPKGASVEYLRMSTDHQRYSFDNQREAISAYAARESLKIVRSYEDAGKSGLTFNKRPGLQALIADSLAHDRDFDTVLVFDISRWGRFQDADESAFYEFTLRRCGVSVVYCAEQFENDGSPVTTIVKSVKRVMAAEFSRELSRKVSAGQRRISRLGFRTGSSAGYGLRRMTISENGDPGVVLQKGQHKAIQTDRIKLIPGPAAEVAIVQRIYRHYVHDKMGPTEIARLLKQEGVPLPDLSGWRRDIVSRILSNEKYVGVIVFGKERSIDMRKTKAPPEEWIVLERAFEPIVERKLFDAANSLRLSRINYHHRETALVELKSLLDQAGFLTRDLIDESPRLPSIGWMVKHFGSMEAAYAAIGYVPPSGLDRRQMAKALRLSQPPKKRRLRSRRQRS